MGGWSEQPRTWSWRRPTLRVPPARRRRLAVAIASLRLAMARRSGQFSSVVDQVNLLDASISDESSDQVAMGSELRAVALLNLGDRRDVVRATGRCRSPPLRGSRPRSNDRPPLPGGRVSGPSRFPVEDGLGRGRTRARPTGGSPRRSSTASTIGRFLRPRLERLAAWRSGWASSTRERAGCVARGR